jgi:thiopurine S-methyltransferase
MDPEFWRERWRIGQLGFHQGKVNAHLVEHYEKLVAGRPSAEAARVLVPLCGKTVDLLFLAEAGHEVVGIELVEQAAEAFFEEHGLAAQVKKDGAHRWIDDPRLELVVGDFFEQTPAELGTFDAIWDRAALVALPPELRARYAPHLAAFAKPGARLLLVTFVFDGPPFGPPHSVEDDEVRALFSPYFTLERVGEADLSAESPRFRERGATFLHEHVWLGTRR